LLLVANWTPNSVSVIDVIQSKEIARITTGLSPYGIDIAPDGSKALVANYDSNNVSVIDLATKQETGQITVGEKP